MTPAAFSLEYGAAVGTFKTLDRTECIEVWRRHFGRKPPRHASVPFMRRALAYQAQVDAHGGLSPAVKRALERSLKTSQKANGKTASAPPASSLGLRPGTHLVREWNGRTYQIEVLEDGFQMDGKRYRSLSAIARKITSAHWSGPRFFGLG